MEDETTASEDKRRHVTLYDAVAGRVGYEGFLSEQQQPKSRDTASTSLASVPAEEVLFRRKGAPTRFEEDDLYASDRYLQSHQRLPDSDLLKVVHAYTADFYSSVNWEQNQVDFRSLDETALLAVGILLEEAASAAIGKTGDLALLEPSGVTDDGSEAEHMYWHEGRLRRSVISRVSGGRGIPRPGREDQADTVPGGRVVKKQRSLSLRPG